MTPQQQKAYVKAARLCSMKEYCELEIRGKIKNYELPIEQEDELIDALIEEKYLSNERYTKAFVNDKIKFNKWGKQKVRQALHQKKIPEAITDEQLSAFDEEAYQELVRAELQKKQASIVEEDPFKLKNKLLRFSLSRGYEIDLTYNLLDTLLKA